MTLTAHMVKDKARQLGADLAGIAAGDVLERFPPDPQRPQTPSRISREDSKSVIVLARHLLWGTMRLPGKNDRQKQYAAELTLSELEETSLNLVYYLEEHGFPAITLPPLHTDPEEYPRYVAGGAYGPLSLVHAAVEAGLGSLGLNLMLLTPEYGPRVLLAGVMTSAVLAPDRPIVQQLCAGPACGRCLLACPGDAILHWGLEKARCAPYASPYGFDFMRQHVEHIMRTPDTDTRLELARGKASFEIWQSILRGVGVYSGCTRCVEVCPVGADYAAHLAAVQEEIPEVTAEKHARLQGLRDAEQAGERGPLFHHSARWISGVQSPQEKGVHHDETAL
jgi:epoxyqueuosine reductase QueG